MPQSTTSERSSRLSHSSAVSTPTWPPPRSPLPPHRLAKLANALGVATPLPAIHTHAPPLSTSPPLPNSSASSVFSDHFRRSPTPSVSSAQTYSTTPSSSRYLLHVIPPLHLPHDLDASEDWEVTPAPPTASGYHPQFRRGVLVPVCSTLSTQLSVIAKEYALPSTVGMVLYSVSADAKSPTDEHPELREPGPRISEEMWRHIWHRVLKSEREETSAGLKPIGLGFGVGPHPSNFLQDVPPGTLRPLMSPKRIESPQPQMTPSPSTPSPSVFSHQSDADPPESMSSAPGDQDGEGDIALPGLRSSALIPVLAKVEFDIDRRKAHWYESWMRSRQVNLAKRTESRLGMRKRSGSRVEGDIEEDEEGEDDRKAPIDLKLVGRMQDNSAPRFLRELSGADAEGGYAQLAESPELDANGDDADDEDVTARLNGRNGADPLEEVFGADEETWSEMRAESGPKLEINPNVVPLALDGQALSEFPETEEDPEMEDNDIEEVTEILKRQSRPSLEVSIPSSPPAASKRHSSPTTAGTVRKHLPPPLNLVPALPGDGALSVEVSPQVPRSAESVYLPYLKGSSAHSVEGLNDDDDELLDDDASVYEDEIEETLAARKARSPQDEKREGAIFEDLDLGLGDHAVEYDEDDPHDHRRSQVLMKAQLDEIERTLVQFSPRRLRSEELTDEDVLLPMPSAHQSSPPRTHGELPSADSSPAPSGASWPAVPYSALNKRDHEPEPENRPPSPPRIAFNGVSTDLPKTMLQQRMSSTGSISDETLARKRAMEEERDLYPPLVASASLQNGSGESPIIPLSPDPFGRFPSKAEEAADFEDGLGPLNRDSTRISVTVAGSDEGHRASKTPSSRFSMDSVTSDDAGKHLKEPKDSKASLMSVKSIKRLWRKTNNKLSVSASSDASGTQSGRTSPNVTSVPPTPQEMPSRPASRTVSRSPQPGEYVHVEAHPEGIVQARPIQVVQTAPPRPRRKSSSFNLQWNQDSPYPVHPVRSPPIDASRQSSPRITPVPSPTPPSPQPAAAALPAERSSGVRKSILKSWRSASGSLSVNSVSSTSTSRSSLDQSQDPPQKKRRPSMLDGTASIKRGSLVSSTTTLVDIPPSPALPEEFANQVRTASRQSSKDSAVDKRSSKSQPRSRPVLSTSPPQNGSNLSMPPRTSGESTESRPSFDDSQFEIVSPKLDSYVLPSYPYHGLDQSMSSIE